VPPGYRENLLGSHLLGDAARQCHGFDAAGDHHLAGSVVVRYPDITLGERAGRLHSVIVHPEDRRHRARIDLGGVLHRRAALGDETEGILVVEGAGGDERRVLAEAVAGADAGLEADTLGTVENDEAEDERGHLGVVGLLERVLVGFAQQLGDVAAGDLGRLIHELEGGVVLPGRAHSRSL
jgi:hypothetical protein